jgi:hypothetical protein
VDIASDRYRKREGTLTSRLVTQTLGDNSLVLEVDVPALGLAGLVLQGEGEDGASLLDGVLALSIVTGEGVVDGLEGLGGRECGCRPVVRVVDGVIMGGRATYGS